MTAVNPAPDQTHDPADPALPDPALIACPACSALNRVPLARLSAQPVCGKCKAPLFGGQPLAVDAAAFDRHVGRGDLPVLVDFWAEWCGPCKSIAPMVDDIAKEYAGRLKVAKVNIDENQKTPMTYGIRGIPTLMVFKGGKVEATQIGAVGKGQLTSMIDKAI